MEPGRLRHMTGCCPIGAPISARLEAEFGDYFDMLGWQLVDKARADRIDPLAVDPAVGRERDMGPVTGAGQPDISEPAFLLERGDAILFERPLVGKQPFLEAG